VWPSRKETWITSVMVFIMVVVAAACVVVVAVSLIISLTRSIYQWPRPSRNVTRTRIS
jgi:preprotein translocase subunit SecE